ncbi:MAG: peptidylprolyl isomerase [Gemmatimonadota bacterium]
MPHHHPTRLGSLLSLFSLLLLLPLWGCGNAPLSALELEGVAWTSDELLGVTAERRMELAGITALGLAVTRNEVVGLAEARSHRTLRLARIAILASEEALQEADVSDDALEAHYLSNPAWELEVRHLVRLVDAGASQEEVAAARAAAQGALDRVQAGEDFASVAGEISQEPGARERGGLLQPGREGSWVPEFWQAALSLEEGGTSPVVETEYGFHVLRLERRSPVPFQEARPQVVREAARLLLGSDPTEAQLTRVQEELVLDLDALESWLGGNPSPPPLALWQGESMAASRLLGETRHLPWSRFQPLLEGGVEAWGAFLPEAAAELFLDEAALAREIVVPLGEVEAIKREALQDIQQLAAPFSFQPGMSPEALKARALEGLRGTGQGLRIARESLPQHLPLLLSVWPVLVEGEPLTLP